MDLCARLICEQPNAISSRYCWMHRDSPRNLEDQIEALRAEVERLEGLLLDSDSLAKLFHTVYEELAPRFGYRTREESARPWGDVPEANRRLMVAVCEYVARALLEVK